MYDEFPRIEEEFRAALDESLEPRGPELLYEIVEGLGLPEGSLVLDVGCGDGRHSYRLAERFGFSVVGIDPAGIPTATRQVRFLRGVAEVLPVEDRTADLVWCRDVLVHVADLERAYHEFHRVLRDGGRTLVYQMFATDAGQVLRRRLRRRVQDAPAWPAHPSETTGRHAGVSSASGTIV